MFDIGFAEILLIALVSLIVIGPNRLPETIRTLALWLGRARRTYSQFRKDLEQEIGADEIRQDLRNEEIMAQLKETQQQLHNSLDINVSGTGKVLPDNKNAPSPEQTPLKTNNAPDHSNE